MAQSTSVFEHPECRDHEQVIFCRDAEAGLEAIVAIHSTRLGPAMGGCRMWAYGNGDAALTDALRLSHGMSLKNAMAELAAGGGKAVIIGDPRRAKTPRLLRRFGAFVESLCGAYVTAEDVGISVADLAEVARETTSVSGLGRGAANSGGDPSPWTALGVFAGLQAAVAFRLGRRDLDGIRIAVQGLGSVGFDLCRRLHLAGARLWVADLDAQRVAAAEKQFGAVAVAADAIAAQAVDVFAPCALGGVLDAATIDRLQATVVAGAANNQLATVDDGARLAIRDILYAPDYVINAGGIISVAAEYAGTWDRRSVQAQVEAIGPRTGLLLAEAVNEGLPPALVADRRAEARLREAA